MPQKLRIAVVAACPIPAPRGTPTRVLRLSEALARDGHEVHIVTYHFGATAYEPSEPNLFVHRIANVPTYDKLDPGPSVQKLLLLDPMLLGRLNALLAGNAFDVIHAHHYEGLLVGAWARRGYSTSLVYDAHTLLAKELPYFSVGLPRALKSSLGRALDRRLPRLADGIIAVSTEIERELRGLMATPDRVCTVPNGVELDVFPPRKAVRTLGAPRRHSIVYSGTLSVYQGIETLLASFAQVAARRDDTVLKIVSDSSFEPYESLSSKLGIRDRIELARAELGELSALFDDADVAVNPRIGCAGLPQKNLNYMAAEIPIVCFAGSAKQLVAGRTALVVADGDVSAFADAVIYLLDHPEQAAALGARARRYVEQHVSWEASARMTAQFYDELGRLRAVRHQT